MYLQVLSGARNMDLETKNISIYIRQEFATILDLGNFLAIEHKNIPVIIDNSIRKSETQFDIWIASPDWLIEE